MIEPPSVTTLSSRGQIVIPDAIRKQLELKKGDCFVIRVKKSSIVLEKVK